MTPEEEKEIVGTIAQVVTDLLVQWMSAYNESNRLDSPEGYASSRAYAACCVSLARSFNIEHLPQIQQLLWLRESG